MTTTDVIAGGYSSRPEHVDKQLAPGRSPGTWVGGTALASGESYTVRTYSPSPSPTELATDRGPYPGPALASELTIELPTNAGPHAIRFPTFHSGERPDGIAVIDHSPYARAYALAVQLAERTATPYGFALAIERFLSQANGFAYDENPPQSAFPLETFLFAARRGYCQHFAGAMALLLRMGGVPARVATGFTTGDYDSAARKYVVSDLDAHAWVEVWFPRYGWVRFDPTPGGAPARGGSSALLPGLSGRLPIGLAPKPGSRSPTGHTTGAGRVSARPHGGGLPLTWLAVGTVLAIAVVALLGWWALRPVTAEQLVAELEQAIARVALAPRGITLRALERRFSGSTGAECYVRRLRLARFSDGQELPGPAERRALRNQIASGRGLAGRLRAWWALPPRVLH
jgi:transglutaminase-like putative cysteine protease